MNVQIPYPTPPATPPASIASSAASSFLLTSASNSPNLQSPPLFYNFPNEQISGLSIEAVSIPEYASITSPLLHHTSDANSLIVAADQGNHYPKIVKYILLLATLIGGSTFSISWLNSQSTLPLAIHIPLTGAILLAVFCMGGAFRERASLMRSEFNTRLIDTLV